MIDEATHERLIGASVLDQRLFDAIGAHEHDEQEIIDAYAAFAERTSSQTVRYLINLIVEDERRHHRVLMELANTIRAEVTFEERGSRMPYLDVHRGDIELLEATKRFLDIERHDREELRALSRQVNRNGAPLEGFMLKLVLEDSDRHIRILRFIERLVRHSPLP
jgi:hypothetical protein